MRAQGARGLSPAVRVCTRGYVRTCLCCVWYRHVCVHVCVVLNVVYAHVCCVVWGVPAGYMRTRVLCARVRCVCLCTWGKPSEVLTHGTGGAAPAAASASLPAPAPRRAGRPPPRPVQHHEGPRARAGVAPRALTFRLPAQRALRLCGERERSRYSGPRAKPHAAATAPLGSRSRPRCSRAQQAGSLRTRPQGRLTHNAPRTRPCRPVGPSGRPHRLPAPDARD